MSKKISVESTLVDLIDNIVSERLVDFRDSLESEFKKAVDAATHPNPLMSRKETADYLGISFPTLHQMMKDGRLKYTKIGASTKFDRAEVERLGRTSRRAGV